VIVKLNGRVQTTDKSALNAIVFQLKMEAVLNGMKFTSLAECLKLLISKIRNEGDSQQPIFFVIEELDQFVTQRKQKLLYTLLDTLHTVESKSRMALIGITAVLDISETLEKRVSSRFASTRQIFYFHLENMDDILKVLINSLSVPNSDTRLRRHYNKAILSLFQSPIFKNLIAEKYNITKNIRYYFTLFSLAIRSIDESRPCLHIFDLEKACQLLSNDSRFDMIKGLTNLELKLMVGYSKLLEEKANPINFEMIYNECVTFSKLVNMQFPHQETALQAFERLISIEIFKFLYDPHCYLPKQYRPVMMLMMRKQLIQALQNPKCPTDVQRWGEKWLE